LTGLAGASRHPEKILSIARITDHRITRHRIWKGQTARLFDGKRTKVTPATNGPKTIAFCRNCYNKTGYENRNYRCYRTTGPSGSGKTKKQYGLQRSGRFGAFTGESGGSRDRNQSI